MKNQNSMDGRKTNLFLSKESLAKEKSKWNSYQQITAFEIETDVKKTKLKDSFDKMFKSVKGFQVLNIYPNHFEV